MSKLRYLSNTMNEDFVELLFVDIVSYVELVLHICHKINFNITGERVIVRNDLAWL